MVQPSKCNEGWDRGIRVFTRERSQWPVMEWTLGRQDNEEDMARAWMGMKEQRRVAGLMDDRARGDERQAERKDCRECHVMLWKASSKILRL